MCRIGMRVGRQVLSHEWIIMDTNITHTEREREGKKKKKRFSYNSYFHLAFYKIYSLIQM